MGVGEGGWGGGEEESFVGEWIERKKDRWSKGCKDKKN